MRARRIDNNQSEIVSFFRTIGCSVFVTSSLGGGFPDLAVSYKGKTVLIEIKDGETKKLTPPERKFFDEWQGLCARVNCLDDAILVWERIK